jgi:TolB protein
LYYSIGGVWYRTDGTANAKSVNPFGSGNNSATYSPDRQRMAYTNGGTIYIAQTKNSSLATPLIQGNYPSWGPTGQIIFQGCFNGQCGLHVINPDNPGQVTRLSSSSADIAPRWSPFGGEIVYMSNHSGAWEIYSVTIGGQFRQLTGFRASSGLPVWSPDGGRVAFVSNRDGAWGVYTMYNDGSNVQKLIDLGANAPNWQNDRMAWTP